MAAVPSLTDSALARLAAGADVLVSGCVVPDGDDGAGQAEGEFVPAVGQHLCWRALCWPWYLCGTGAADFTRPCFL